ncbi:MAG: hypothetical protein GWM98_27620, partial [Nitrospinaceae bacterium]|nr:DNA repair exonuclease [Nitrospinaceae bacterium]NIR57534.1 DNA repair exonuclease [Nitrospinaceae bacterium]NIS88004.1 DNA repair exonuclease [Nitrospinaceae bacterium]NIT84868.1 DNA repair exonuclease [Nitrospinaceae bacterium]NIU47044.1 DNA repair exonuclease [Nitrospinaceae bacterium]
MTSFRFLHCSDLHIDSPFRGISSDQPKLAEKLRRSTLRAYQNIIQLALRERVDAVVIAGDIYDSEDKSLQAQLKFRQGLQELAEAGIPAFVAHGNHDPLNGWSATLDLPETVRIFPGGEVTRLPVKRGGKPVAHVYGISYAQKEVTDNLARKFQRDPGDEFAIGVLHANVGNNPDHLNYAPCSLADLVEAGMDYWALGHIHAHKVLRENQPAIVFSGNPQARFHREAGEKGCCLVTLHSHSPPEVQFVPVDEV